MKNEMWKRSLRRGAALVLALVMSLTITSCSASQGSLTARERAREPEYVSKAGGKVHEAVPYSRRPYEHTMTRLPWNRPWLILNRPVLRKAGKRKC